MNSSQMTNDKNDFAFDKSKSNQIPIVICLDSESEHQVIQPLHPECNQNRVDSQAKNDDKRDQKEKRIRKKRSKKSKKVERQIHEINDDDIEAVKQNRKSNRLSKKGPKNYKPLLKRRIVRTNTDIQRRNLQKQLQNIVPPLIIMTLNSEGPVGVLLNRKMDIQKPIFTVENSAASVFDRMFPEVRSDQIKQLSMRQEGLQIIQHKNYLQADKKHVEVQSTQLVEKDNHNLSNFLLLQHSQRPDERDSEVILAPSQKFYKQFLEKNIVTDRRNAIYNSVIKYSCPKPQKYMKAIEQSVQKQNEKQKQKQKFSSNSNETKNLELVMGESKQKVPLKSVEVIMIDDSSDDENDKDQGKMLQSAQVQQLIQPVIQSAKPMLIQPVIQSAKPMQIEQVNGQNQNLQISYCQIEEQRISNHQNRQKPVYEHQVQENFIEKPMKNDKLMEQQQSQEYIELPPGQKFTKSSLKKKITKKTVYYSTVDQITQQWQNSEYFSLEEEYPFYSQKLKTNKCNLFTDKLRSIVKIKKYDHPENHPTICIVFYKSQFDTHVKSQQKLSNNQYRGLTGPLPHQVELNKVRLLQPQKLLQFYEMASHQKKTTCIDEAQTVYDLPQRTQDRIKNLYQ